MKNFSGSLREHTMRITNTENMKIIPLTNKQPELHERTKICYICEKTV